MNKRQTATFLITACAIVVSMMKSAFAEPDGGPATNEKKSAHAGKPYSPKQTTWKVPSDDDVQVKVVSMGLSKVFPVGSGFSLVWVNEGYAATDYGPYNRLFLVYHSDAEMPHYQETFLLGNIHSVASAKLLDKQSLQIETSLHGRLNSDPVRTPASGKVRLVVDLSEVHAAMKDPTKKEGTLSVSVKITASELLRAE